MDKTVPPGAALLLDFIRDTEVGRMDRASYDVIFANKQGKLPKPLTSMTIGEVVDAQRKWSKNHGSSAAGGYQFMRATLQGLAAELHLNGNQVLDPDLQDRLGYHLLKRRGYEEFMSGNMSLAEFGKRLAQEWASFPVLLACKGAHRDLKRGQSYYAGDGLNKALVKPEAVEGLLAAVKLAGKTTKPTIPPVSKETLETGKPAPKPGAPIPRPVEPKRGLLTSIIDVFLVLFRGWR